MKENKKVYFKDLKEGNVIIATSDTILFYDLAGFIPIKKGKELTLAKIISYEGILYSFEFIEYPDIEFNGHYVLENFTYNKSIKELITLISEHLLRLKQHKNE